jgi:hypothetical protein
MGEYDGDIFTHAGRVAVAMTNRWAADYPDAGGSFLALLSGTDTGGPGTSNFSLVGAPTDVLRQLRYPVTSVPSMDDRIQACVPQILPARLECWASVDEYVMENVIPWVPLFILSEARMVSARVIAYSFDQFASRPALDRIALKPGT